MNQILAKDRQDRVQVLNWFPIGAMCLFWMAPLVLFWGAAFGPLKPFDYPARDTAPSKPVFIAILATGFLPGFLTDTFYRIRSREAEFWKKDRIGIRFFKRFVTNGDLINRRVRRKSPGYSFLKGTGDLETYLRMTVQTERAHLCLFCTGMATVLYAIAIGWSGWGFLLFAGNILVNLYPCLVQRYNRSRLVRLIKLQKHKVDLVA